MVPLVTWVGIVAVTVGVAAFSQVVVTHQERTLLSERANEVNLVLTNSLSTTSTDLETLARDVGRGGVAAFALDAQDQLSAAPTSASASLALLRPSGGSFVVLAEAGPGLVVGQTAPAPEALAMRAALAGHSMAATGVYGSGSSRSVGFATAAPGDLVVYRQTVIGPVHPPSQAQSAPFSELRVVVYASPRPEPREVLVATTRSLPLHGSVKYVALMAGQTRWLTAVSAVHPLIGSLAAAAPWVVLGVGLAGSVLVFFLFEGMAYRRDLAMRALESEHRFAEALQRRLLPELPVLAELDVASSYVPGSDNQRVGGDWFDVFTLDDGKTAVVIGDVMGHDEEAAAAMAQLRSAVRAYAAEGGDPSWVVGRLARLVDMFDIAGIVTMIYGVLDPAGADGSRTFCWANAGHLPPLLRSPDGTAGELPGGSSPLLGAPFSGPRPMARHTLEAGSALLLYTDGLVESHGENLGAGIGRLVGVLEGTQGSSAAELCQAVLNEQVSGALRDDVALVVVRTLSASRPEQSSGSEEMPAPARLESADDSPLVFADQGDPESARRARRYVARALSHAPDELRADAELVVSELVTNAVLHGEPPITVRVRRTGDRVRLEVEDAGRNLPVIARQRSDAMTGRGLPLVAAVASGWGVESADTGKAIWAELNVGPASEQAGVAPVMDREAILDSWPDPNDRETPVRYTLRLGSVPTGLLLSAKAHIDNVVREFSLIRNAAEDTRELPPAMARLIETVTTDFADARAEIKRQALDSAARGQSSTDLELHLPLEAADAGERYLAALDAADQYAREARLLTLAAPPSHRKFRQWYVSALVSQLRAIAAGETPAETVPFAEILSEEIDHLAALQQGDTELSDLLP